MHLNFNEVLNKMNYVMESLAVPVKLPRISMEREDADILEHYDWLSLIV